MRQVTALVGYHFRFQCTVMAKGKTTIFRFQAGAAFRRLDTDLTSAIAADQASFRSTAQRGRDALTGLEAGMIVLSLVMVACCAWGITRRLAEYR